MEKEPNQEVDNLKEGNAVGVWIVRKSKSYPGHNYYFNTLTGAAVWNLSEQEIVNATHKSNLTKFDHQAEPKEKPPMAKFNPRTGFIHPVINNVNYSTQAFPIPPFVCPQTTFRNSLPPINALDLIATQPKLNPNIWDLGIRQQIVILPTITPLNQQQSFSFGYDLQQRNYLQQRNDLHEGNDLQQRNDSQSRQGLHKINNTSARQHMFRNSQYLNKFGGNKVQNRYCKTWNKQDLRKKLSKHKNYMNTLNSFSKEGYDNSAKIKQNESKQEEEEGSCDSVLLKENEEDCITKLDCTPLKDLSETTVRKNCWYLVVDTNVLVQNFNYLNNLTSTDPTCCFFVPHCVLDELKSYAEEEHGTTARRVLRFLSDCAHIGVEELENQSDFETANDALNKIYNVCLNLEKDNYHVVLVSDDKNLLKYKNIIHVFSMAEVKNMISSYVSQQKILSQSMSDRIVRKNQNDFNHDAVNGKRVFFNSQRVEDNRRIVNSPSKSINTHICTESSKNYCQLKPFSDISVTINNTHKRTNVIEETNVLIIDHHNNIQESLTPIDEDAPCIGEKKRVIRLNRNILPCYKNTPDTPQIIAGTKKFKWRKRRNRLSENNTRSSIVDSEHTVENTESLESVNNKSERKEENSGSEEKPRDCDKIESNNSCTLDNNLIKNTDILKCRKDILKENSDTKMQTNRFGNDRSSTSCISVERPNTERLDNRNNITENNVADSDKEINLQYLENEETSSSCTIVKQFTDDCIIINDSSSSEIISQSGSNVDTSNKLNIEKRPKLLRRFNNINRNLLNNVMYTVTSKAMEVNLKMKSDEWVSRFFQIMEDVLSQILRQESVIERIALPPPWSLQEAVKCIIKVFYCHCYVVDAANKLSIISNKIQNTESITNILPEEFMEMYSYGVYLVDALKDVKSNEDLNIASKSLSDLLYDIEFDQHDTFVDDASENKGETAMISNNALNNSVHPNNEIHIQHNSSPQGNDNCSRQNVVDMTPTSFKIKEDIMVTYMPDLLRSNTINEEDNHEVTNETPETQETNHGDVVVALAKSKNNDSTTEPKIVRCFTKFAQFEERLKNSYRSVMNIDSIDNDIFSDEEHHYETADDLMDDGEFTDDLYETNHTPTCSTAVGGHNKQVDLFFKSLFSDIKNVLSRVTEFCKSCVSYLNNSEPVNVDMKLQVKTEKVHSEVISLHYYLNSIVNRENGQQNIDFLLKKAGCDCKELSEEYRNTILKCKEQTSTVLKIVEHISLVLKR